jgi:hypothetical protein
MITAAAAKKDSMNAFIDIIIQYWPVFPAVFVAGMTFHATLKVV